MEVWISLIVLMTGAFVFFHVKHIDAQTYGLDFHRVIRYFFIFAALFLTLLVDSVRRVKLRNLRTHYKWLFWFFLYALIVSTIADYRFAIPMLCPVLTLYLSPLTRERWLELTVCASVSYYLVFAYKCMDSLVNYRNNLEVGRLIGSFLTVDNAGMICSGAFVCLLYWVFLTYTKKKNWILFAIEVLLLIPTVGFMLWIDSRAGQFAVVALFLCFFVFGTNKTTGKGILFRVGILVGLAVLVIFALFAYSAYLNRQLDRQIITIADLSYWQIHVYVLTSEVHRIGYFPVGSILNAIDYFSSCRLRIFVASLTQIGFWGKPFEDIIYSTDFVVTTPHNFYIYWLIRYGILGGLPLLLWFFTILMKSLIVLKRKEVDYYFSACWVILCSFLFIPTTIIWRSSTILMLLFLQYPFLVGFVEKEPEQESIVGCA
ncbi:MAG: hypothetical protein ACI4HQ_06905 [Acetatifactor sp.]